MFNTGGKTHQRSAEKKWTVSQYGKEQKERCIKIEL
jgi:hypothetical protein